VGVFLVCAMRDAGDRAVSQATGRARTPTNVAPNGCLSFVLFSCRRLYIWSFNFFGYIDIYICIYL
jgi:hypothetical protein